MAKLFLSVARTRFFIPSKYFINNQPVTFTSIYNENVNKFKGLVSIQIRKIHVTTPNQVPPVILIYILRPLAKVGTILLGRYFKKWWRKQTPEEQKKFLKSNWKLIAFVASLLVGFSISYRIRHLQEDPITKRKKFIIFNDEEIKTIAQLEFENQMREFKSDVVPINSKLYRRVERVATRILESNSDIAEIHKKKWRITVIDRPEIYNAFVLANGNIFVFSGMLNICTNDDELAIVLAHEITHAICNHCNETMSSQIYVEILQLPITGIIWAYFDVPFSLISEFGKNAVTQIALFYPFSRELEMEADKVGLTLAAKACFDVRQAPVFWGKMSKINAPEAPLKWLSTHPSHKERQIELRKLVKENLKVREECKCPSLMPLSMSAMYYGGYLL